jgi:hypothetical protein
VHPDIHPDVSGHDPVGVRLSPDAAATATTTATATATATAAVCGLVPGTRATRPDDHAAVGDPHLGVVATSIGNGVDG